jgi:tRNA-dihydrouridine synthase B
MVKSLPMNRKPVFWVGRVPVYNDVILAPMAGYADVPQRTIARAYGSAMSYTEFVSVEELLGNNRAAWALLDRRPDESPMTFQIFGNDPQLFLTAAQRIEALGPDLIDVNMGCSTRKVSGRGAGVGMMRQPELVAQTISLLSRHLAVPVTAKIRLGWEDQQNYLEIGRLLEDSGAAMIAIHPRTKEQKYSGTANWDAIAALKQAVTIPVIGCGDVQSPADIDRMKSQTGCDAVMIGRAAIGNPWLLARRDRTVVTGAEIIALVRQHLAEMLVYYGEERGLILFRKHLNRYLETANLPAATLKRLLTTQNVDEFHDQLAQVEARWRHWSGRVSSPVYYGLNSLPGC